MIGDFVGVVAEREEHAIKAAAQLKVTWKPTPDAARSRRSRDGAARQSARRRARWSTKATSTPRSPTPPSRCIAPTSGPTRCTPRSARPARSPMFASDGIAVWSGTQNPHVLRADLALLTGRPRSRDRSGPDGGGRLLRPQLRRRRRRRRAAAVARGRPSGARATDPRAGARLGAQGRRAADGRRAAGLNADGSVAAYDFATRYPSNGAPTLALLLTGTVAPIPAVFEMGDRTAIPPYDYDNMRVVAHDMAPIVRASWLRGVSALPNTFAHESYIDELATEAGVDPGRVPAAPSERPARGRSRQRGRRARRLATAPGLAAARGRRRHPARPRLCLCALCAQQVARLRRGLVGLGRRRRGQQGDRRGQRDARRRRPGRRPDDQSGRRAAPDPRQRDPVDQPRAEGGGAVRPQRR